MVDGAESDTIDEGKDVGVKTSMGGPKRCKNGCFVDGVGCVSIKLSGWNTWCNNWCNT